ncbi:MAG: minor extracellular serine protease Vpr, partial [Pseudonocardiales bacterium]|nr:minor extracellular serine protease Vpr [Pseudonocardiales bacterium]
ANGTTDNPTQEGTFNAFNPSISTGMFNTVAPNHTASQPVTLDAAEFALTPNRGVMVISHDNMASTEAQLIPFP